MQSAPLSVLLGEEAAYKAAKGAVVLPTIRLLAWAAALERAALRVGMLLAVISSRSGLLLAQVTETTSDLVQKATGFLVRK